MFLLTALDSPPRKWESHRGRRHGPKSLMRAALPEIVCVCARA